MAVLGATSLTGCTSIPSFIASGSKTVFRMASTPVSWTKDTAVNTGTLRVVSGSVSSGGSLIWDQIFTTRPYSFSTVAVQDGGTINSQTVTISVEPNNFLSPQTTGDTTIAVPTMRSHTHPFNQPTPPRQMFPGTQNFANAVTAAQATAAGGGGSHNHAINSVHTHPFPAIPNANHQHPLIKIPHSHTVSGSVDFNLTYVDIIIASKD
jgi:hypothetical protein